MSATKALYMGGYTVSGSGADCKSAAFELGWFNSIPAHHMAVYPLHISRQSERYLGGQIPLHHHQICSPLYGPVAQLGEHLPCKQEVRGSSPLRSTINP